MIRLVIPGPAAGKGRPRFSQGRTFTPAKTEQAERDVKAIWRENGSPRIDGPLVAHVTVEVERPAGHYKRDMTLSAEGQRHPFPCKRPDLDNVVKLLLDSLNGMAYKDDSQVVELHVRRVWAPGNAQTILTLLPAIGHHWIARAA